MRGRLYSSCASSTWSLPSAVIGVLGEDVEDQLGAIDDAGLERVLERALLHRRDLVVDDQNVGAASRLNSGLELRQLALADEEAWIGLGAVLDELGDDLDAGGPRQLAQLGSARCSASTP